MTKPTIALSRFADQPGADIIAPPSGVRDYGFGWNTPALPGPVNALFNQAYLWAQYLDAATLDGDHTIDGNLTVNGNASGTGDLNFAGLLTIGNGAYIYGSIANTISLGAGATVAAGPLSIRGILTPSALSAGNNNDYNPTGLASAVVLRVGRSAGSPFITGIAGGTSGRVLHIVNVDTDDIVITHEDASSTAANRFHLPNSTSFVTIRDGGAMTVWYDSDSNRWRPLSQNL